jgi:hypothetical protein
LWGWHKKSVRNTKATQKPRMKDLQNWCDFSIAAGFHDPQNKNNRLPGYWRTRGSTIGGKRTHTTPLSFSAPEATPHKPAASSSAGERKEGGSQQFPSRTKHSTQNSQKNYKSGGARKLLTGACRILFPSQQSLHWLPRPETPELLCKVREFSVNFVHWFF